MSPAVTDVIEYRGTTVCCPICRTWCCRLVITDAGCTFTRPGKKKRAAP